MLIRRFVFSSIGQKRVSGLKYLHGQFVNFRRLVEFLSFNQPRPGNTGEVTMDDARDEEIYLRRLKIIRVAKKIRNICLAMLSVALEIAGIIIVLWPLFKTGKENYWGIPVALAGVVFMFIYYYQTEGWSQL